jgi:hypothetical protein
MHRVVCFCPTSSKVRTQGEGEGKTDGMSSSMATVNLFPVKPVSEDNEVIFGFTSFLLWKAKVASCLFFALH